MTASSPGQERSRTGEQSRHRGGAEILHEPVVGSTAFEARVEGHAFLVVNVPGVTTFAPDLAAP